MDNMLYILAALVIILLLAVLVMRRRAQKFTFLGDNRKIKNDKSYKGFSSPEKKPLNNVNNESIATKFDNVTIAERFMDQQRYDKAIETLKRGLTETPHDGSLLLKLLNVYVVSNQYHDFDRVYHTLQAHGDQETIEQADQLKELIRDKHVTSFDSDFSEDTSLDNSSFVNSADENPAQANPFYDEELSLDFDNDQAFSSNATDDNLSHQDSNNDSFDLTLDDLEAAEFSEDLNIAEDNDLSNTQIEEVVLSTTPDHAANIDDDFTLDFEDFNEEPAKEHLADNHAIDISDSDELNIANDFTLDLEEYAAKLEKNVLNEDQSIAEHNIEHSLDEFSFDLEDSTDRFDDVTSPVLDNKIVANTDTPINEIAFADLSKTDLEVVDVHTDNAPATDALEALSPAIDDDIESANNELFNEDLMFDDLVFDDDNGLDIEAVTDPTSPVSAQKIILTNNLAPVTLDTILSSDFDYVKTLNSYQVTLELADHYLQLGEYGSAKRLLTEVIAQGSSEQQRKAKMLLARTA